MLRVRLLGELTVEVDLSRVELPRAWRAHLVLGWLALHPGTHPRAALAARFWPEAVDVKARVSSWVTAVRAADNPEARRPTRRAAATITVAAALKSARITRVNPGFRDPTASSDDVRARARAGLLGNGVTAVALAAGLVELLAWRRHRGGRGADEFRPRRRSVVA